MKNITLNSGGIIGAVGGLAIVIGIVLVFGGQQAGSRIGQFGVIALFAGAFGGNYLWQRILKG